MELKQILARLQDNGTAQNRKVYSRHGVKTPLYGVSYKYLGILKKEIKENHPLALLLWNTENHDARVLSTMIVNKNLLDENILECWVDILDNPVITDAFTKMVWQSELLAYKKMEEWSISGREWKGRVGWSLLTHFAMDENNSLTNEYCVKKLEYIRENIHSAFNRVKDAMNSALVAIGIRNDVLQKKALEIATIIGKVEVDYGQTHCKTRDAYEYIISASEYKAKKKNRKISSC